MATHKALSLSPVADEWGDLFVIGGESVFAEALPLADRLYLTLIDYEEDGDTFFPADPTEQFDVLSTESLPADEKNTHSSRYMVMERKAVRGLSF